MSRGRNRIWLFISFMQILTWGFLRGSGASFDPPSNFNFHGDSLGWLSFYRSSVVQSPWWNVGCISANQSYVYICVSVIHKPEVCSICVASCVRPGFYMWSWRGWPVTSLKDCLSGLVAVIPLDFSYEGIFCDVSFRVCGDQNRYFKPSHDILHPARE